MKQIFTIIFLLSALIINANSESELPGSIELESNNDQVNITENLSGLSCLSVIFNPNAVICGTTTITAQVNCNFSGIVQLYVVNNPANITVPTGDISVYNGIFQFDITVDEGAPGYIDIITTVTSIWSDPENCVLDAVCEPSTLVTMCAVPENDTCEEALDIDVSLNHCDYEAYSNNLWSASGINGNCAANMDKDLFFRFEAISEELHVLFGELPSNSMTFEIFNSCYGEVIFCLTMGPYTNITVDNLTEGAEYLIRLSDLQDDDVGLIEMCIWSPFVCDLEGIAETIQDETCPGECNGIASVEPEFGTPPYNYSWSNNSNTQNSYNLCPGTHYVTITDVFGCEVVDSVVIAAGLNPLAEAGPDLNLCEGGTGQLHASGGEYYQWWPSIGLSDTLVADPLANPGVSTTYYLTVVSEQGCIGTDSVTIWVHENPEIQITGDTMACHGDSILLTVAEENLDFVWSTSDSTDYILTNQGGTYSVIATDTFGCIAVDSFELSFLPAIQSDYIVNHESGFGFKNGIIEASIHGGMAPYEYMWNTSDTSNIIQDLAPGIYSLHISDAYGCIHNDTLEINAFVCPPLTIDSEYTPLVCDGECSGSVKIKTVEGHSGPYGISWNNGMATDSITSLCAGQYNVMITDSLNCSVTDTFLIEQAPSIEIIIDEIRHFSPDKPGVIKLDLDGPYSLEWSGPDGFQAFTENIFGLGEGCYDLFVIDTLTQCTADTTICIDNLTTSLIDLADSSREFKMYPNPARDQITLEWLNDSGPEIKIQVVGIDGKVLHTAYRPADDRIFIVPVGQLEHGMYFLRILSGSEQHSRRFIIAE